MQKLNFPDYDFRIREAPGNGQISEIFDTIRRKYVALTPEEWVRQHMARFLAADMGYPRGRIGMEKAIRVNRLVRRPDLVVFGDTGKPLIVVECKAPSVRVTQAVFDQAARYNLTLNAWFFILTNGIKTYCCLMHAPTKTYHFLETIPNYEDLKSFTGGSKQ
jgi:type I site-specific restriction endonuclease